MTKKIKIQIFPDGTIQTEIQGIKGKRCTEYIHILEELLEAEAVDSNYTPEFHETETVKITEKQEQRIRER
ncbi:MULTISPECIES: DUF2997 domain-containing protein [Methanobacterium]|jgi:hypothetical protein|uniref:DUF2997 domain-containing protein n=2 Tax=Methanobacterium TaxID=2160 RepID=A0A9E5DPQ4_9EURY|nr:MULTISPECIES: DUF2997 domain-containing protein [Methanobacterium]MCZ3366916.1 DUF2997 domain-containing protein [Methanobacterium veterum]MCZ3373937.1 DUF2997 domain-containing protein [Methanobacterium veterum]OEC87080.1 hypothetical protein A9507_09300 [Methanobacterium sp. A39]PAV06145.1 hypothetical protein ASJ80_15040 [Methanobacterium bryantii]